jgi:heterotetrameric sarcosine oxidase gamma subunit
MVQLNPKLKRLSPLHNQHQILNARFDLREGWLIPEVYSASAKEATMVQESVGLLDISAWGKLMLKGTNSRTVITACLGDSPSKPGDVREHRWKQLLAAGLTPDEFLILTPPGAEKELAASLEAEITAQNFFISVIDLTSGLVGLSISGPKSMAVMSKLCAIPFSSEESPNRYVAQSSFAQIRAMIIRHDRGVLPSFEIFADCSYSEYLWDTVLDAGKEFGMQPVGWEAMGT